MYSVPILFVIFNRKDNAQRTFEAIRKAQPKKLYIASDGPRTPQESITVQDVRQTIENMIDWDCELHKLYRDANIGCADGVKTAIDWLFDNEDRGIILEDDCVADQTFFPFVEKMLELYKDDQRVGVISGYNPVSLKDFPYSYLFSRFKNGWGWATWKRVWENMDYDMSWRDTIYYKSVLANRGYRNKDFNKWEVEISYIDKHYVSAWDYQFWLSLSAQNQLCIYPRHNLIRNIGSDGEATHTAFGLTEIPTKELTFPLIAPPCLCPYSPFEKAFYKQGETLRAKLGRLIPPPVKKKIKKTLLLFKR